MTAPGTVPRQAAPAGWPATGTVAFPGRSGWIALPRSRRLARSGISAYSACRARSVAAQYAAFHAVAVAGPRVLGPVRERPCPLPGPEWEALAAQWQRELGPFDGVVPLLRRQPERSGFAVLLHRAGRRLAFVKLRRDTLGPEPAVLAAAGQVSLRTVSLPRLLATGASGPWHWFATEPLPAGLHRAGRPALAPLAADAADVVRAAVDPGPEVPPHWTASHGDLTVWNVRRSGGRLRVFDWEDATYAPPLTDVVGYLASAAAARGRSSVTLPRSLRGQDVTEAVGHWRRTVAAREGSDPAYNTRLLAALSALAPDVRDPDACSKTG